MGQSLVKNYIHIVFSTKYRQPLIDEGIAEDLYAYLGGMCKIMDCPPIIVGGYKDHIHILCLLSKKIPLMKLLEEVKSHSSSWIKTKGDAYEAFRWQNGYAAFSVNWKGVNAVTRYIANQKMHHSKRDFQDECRMLLRENNVEYDERYIWD